MIILNIDFRKIDQSRLKKTASGSYGDLVLIDSPRERDNGIKIDGFVKQGVTREEREARVDMPIIGDWRYVGGKPAPKQGEHSSRPAPAKRPPADDDDGSGIPF